MTSSKSPVALNCCVLTVSDTRTIADYKAKQDKDKGVPATASHAQPNA